MGDGGIEQVTAAATRDAVYRDAMRASALGLAANLVLGVVKLVGGIVGQSFALISDAVNSFGDAFGSVVVLFALRVAQRPPDAEHPYGHSRAEAIAGSNVALLILGSALVVGWEAFARMGVHHAEPPVWVLWLAAANVVIKEGLYRYKVSVARRTGSIALVANAWDHRADAFCSFAVLVGCAIVRWGGEGWIGADEVAALVVVAAIVVSAVQLFRRSANELMDCQAGTDLVAGVRACAQATDGVRAVEKLWVRKSGLEYFVDIHVQVDPDMSVARGHTVGHAVKDRLLEAYPRLRDVLVHLEPFAGGGHSRA